MSIVDTSSPFRGLSTTETAHLSSAYFTVKNFGFLRLTSNEKSPAWYYPTPTNYIPEGWYELQVSDSNRGDFNGDGLQDLVIMPFMGELTPRKTKVDPLFLIQDGKGGFLSPETIIQNSNFPNIYFQYRIGIADFNGDGIDDAVASAMQDGNTGRGQSPAVYLGNASGSKIDWNNSHDGLTLFQGPPNWTLGYNGGHSMAVGDFNGDSHKDWFSNWYVFTNSGAGQFSASVLIPNSAAEAGSAPFENQWTWPMVNSSVSADFDEDGFDDLIWSVMPVVPNPLLNGGDLWMAKGSPSGLLGGHSAIKLPREVLRPDNVGTNFMVAADFNGDSHQDVLLLEHSWVSDSGDASKYYSEGDLRLFVGDGKGGFSEKASSIVDPLAHYRGGEGNIHVLDVNGDGWKDVVLSRYTTSDQKVLKGQEIPSTSIFLNRLGVLEAVDPQDLAWVSAYQFAGEEKIKSSDKDPLRVLLPVDLYGDGIIDFVGFVTTPLHSWPQNEQRYTYGYILEGKKLLGRPLKDESLVGTLGNDLIRGFDGDDTISGAGGRDTIMGGDGVDIVVFPQALANYQLSASAEGLLVSDKGVPANSALLQGVEVAKFSDSGVVIQSDGKYAVDNAPPLVAVASDKSNLSAGQIANITFTLSEASHNFVVGDVTVSGGMLSGFSGSGTNFKAIFTPTPNSTTNAVVSVASGVFTDAAGNANTDGSDADNSVTLTVNTFPAATSGKDKLTGTSGDDYIAGLAGNDTLTGLAGNDTLDGGADNDSMVGGLGDDTYYVDSTGDKVVELANQGTDTVVSDISLSLAKVANVENWVGTGSADISATGNTLGNALTGNAGANTIDGSLGNDTLTGGAGSDRFVFSSKLGATNIDAITDFVSGVDKIHLSKSVFTKFKAGAVAEANFVSGAKALDSNDYLIFNGSQLLYDADGSGKGAAVVVANIVGTVVASDLFVA